MVSTLTKTTLLMKDGSNEMWQVHYRDKNKMIWEQKEQRQQLCLRHQVRISCSNHPFLVQLVCIESLQ